MSKSTGNVPTTLSKATLEYARKRLEYKEDPIKFMEECIYIPTPGGSKLIKLYEPQKRIIRSFFTDRNLVLLKSRQIGMSTLSQAIITYISTFYENCVVGIVSRSSDESSDFCRKTVEMIDQLPDWLRPKYKSKSIQYFILDNGCQLHTAAVSPANPGAVFRSKSITLLVIDEAAHILNIEDAWIGIANTLSKAQQSAAEHDIPHGTLIISTPNKSEGVGKWYFSIWSGARLGDNAFTPHKIHWSEIPAFADDPDWYKKQCKILNNNKAAIAQELELKFIGTEDSLFDEATQERLQNGFMTPIENVPIPIPKYKGELHKFKDVKRNYFHLIGVDCASEAGADKSAIQVIEYETMEQVLEFSGRVDPKQMVSIIKMICALCPHNILIIENTGGYGHSVIYDLIYDDDIVYNLYGVYTGAKNTFVPGISTNAKTRPLMVDALYTYVQEDTDIIHSERLAMELLGLVNKGNRIEADKGFHDDLALAYAFCCYVRKYCSDQLGITESVSAEEANQSFTMDSLQIMRSINGDTPFAGLRRQAISTGVEPSNTKNDLDKYIREKVMSGELSGYVNVSSLFGDHYGN
jgi:hypothetical protein